MMDDLISRQAAIEAIDETCWYHQNKDKDMVGGANSAEHQPWFKSDDVYAALKSVPSAHRWIPIKTRPMTEEERQFYSEMYGYDVEYEEAVMFDCKMPEDGQEVWVCTKCGNVWVDTCFIDEGIGLEENGDWLDIVAWMPFYKPEPWKGEDDDKR